MSRHSSSAPTPVTRDEVSELRDLGFDIWAEFDAANYNSAVRTHPILKPLPLFQRSATRAVLVGNSRMLASLSQRPCRLSSELAQSPHPLELYTITEIGRISRGLTPEPKVYFSHEDGERRVSMLHVAEVAQIAEIGPVHLAVHAKYGPWFALRAVLIFDEAPRARTARTAQPRESHCADCPAPCQDAFETARAVAGSAEAEARGPAPNWRDWVAVRDACPVGRDERYSESQIHYHYTKDLARLRAAAGVEPESSPPRE